MEGGDEELWRVLEVLQGLVCKRDEDLACKGGSDAGPATRARAWEEAASAACPLADQVDRGSHVIRDHRRDFSRDELGGRRGASGRRWGCGARAER